MFQSTRKGSMSMTDYVQKIKNYADSLAAAGHAIIEQDVLLNVLNGLGNEYDPVVIHITSIEDVISLKQRLEQQNLIYSIEVPSANLVNND
ncbi:hypothetical protein ACOSQ2_014946 [Xanthoceras sorbifolium]